MITRIPFIEWAPDRREVGDDSSFFYLENGYPAEEGYIQAPKPQTIALSSFTSTTQALGSIEEKFDGTTYLFAGTQDGLWRYEPASTSLATNVTPTGTPSLSDLSAGGRWEFVKWDNKIYAASKENLMLSMTADGSVFTAMATAIPKCKTITQARNFLIGGNTVDPTDSTTPNRVRWSALGDPDDWTVSAATQADFTDLRNSGEVLRVFGGEYGIVMTERSAYRMTYIGSPVVWQFDEIESTDGLFGHNAATKVNETIFYYSNTGFKALVNGSSVVPIGKGKVDKFIQDDMVSTDEIRRNSLYCAHDLHATRVFWFYKRDIVGDGAEYLADVYLVYDYVLNKWGYGTIGDKTEAMAPLASTSVTTGGVTPHMGFFFFNSSESDQVAFTTIYANPDDHGMRVMSKKVELAPGRNAMVKNVVVGMENFNDEIELQISGGGTSAAIDTSLDLTVYGFRNFDESRAIAKSVNTTQSATSNRKTRNNVRINGRSHQINMTITVDTIEGSDKIYNMPQLKYVDVEFVPTHWR